MKRVASLIDKLKVCKYWLLDHGDVLIETCHYCKSTHIVKIEGSDDGDFYSARYSCKDCGATCTVREKWKRKCTI